MDHGAQVRIAHIGMVPNGGFVDHDEILEDVDEITVDNGLIPDQCQPMLEVTAVHQGRRHHMTQQEDKETHMDDVSAERANGTAVPVSFGQPRRLEQPHGPSKVSRPQAQVASPMPPVPRQRT